MDKVINFSKNPTDFEKNIKLPFESLYYIWKLNDIDMRKLIFIMFFAILTLSGKAQDFTEQMINSRYQYVILTNPTVSNLEIIRFLKEKHILSVNKRKIRFIGVYHKNQVYNFQQSRDYILEKGLKEFQLWEVKGDLGENDIFRENSCTGDFSSIFEHSIGIFFFGGPDMLPVIYKESNTHSVVTDPGRHIFEVSFLFHLLGGSRNPEFTPLINKKPLYLITGFCLGLQSMNVATGGTLVQDIPFQIYGKNTPQETLTIDMDNLHRNYWQEFTPDKQLMGIHFHPLFFTDHPFFGKEIKVPKNYHPLIYSSHHQSLEQIGTGFEITALSPDGKVIEGMVHSKYRNVFGVQFHPEVNALYEDREKWKFAPDDLPRTYHQIIGKESVAFHRKYWERISDGLRESAKSQ
jgi:putative glutamine amidotransferase